MFPLSVYQYFDISYVLFAFYHNIIIIRNEVSFLCKIKCRVNVLPDQKPDNFNHLQDFTLPSIMARLGKICLGAVCFRTSKIVKSRIRDRTSILLPILAQLSVILLVTCVFSNKRRYTLLGFFSYT